MHCDLAWICCRCFGEKACAHTSVQEPALFEDNGSHCPARGAERITVQTRYAGTIIMIMIMIIIVIIYVFLFFFWGGGVSSVLRAETSGPSGFHIWQPLTISVSKDHVAPEQV